MIDELEEFQRKFFNLFDKLEEARPSLTGEAYKRMTADILEQYDLEYEKLNLENWIPTKQKIEKLQARKQRLVPDRWVREKRFLWFKRLFKREVPEQNHIADLVDAEADLDAARYFEAYEEHIADQARAYAEMQALEARVEAEGDVQTAASEMEQNDTEPVIETVEPPAEEDSEDTQDVEIEVEEFDEDFGIDTEYEIVEDGEEDSETAEEGEDPADEQTPEPGADEPSEGTKDDDQIEEEGEAE